MRYNVSPRKNKKFYNFPVNKLCITKILKAKTFYSNWKRRGSRPLIVINPLPKYG